ncbi:MAG TPA: hypothetical protein VNI20_10470 [Fimbriimonadaceae bacterium]|nr:hypothetical protein [Fimbriimonadaceae bacterium]
MPLFENAFGNSARAINDLGQVTGSSTVTTTTTRAYLYSAGTLTNLGTLNDDNTSTGRSINKFGHVAGFAGVLSAANGFLYNGSSLTDIGSLIGHSVIVQGMNDSDTIVGFDEVVNYHPRAFLYKNGSMTDISDGHDYSIASAVNNAGTVVGYFGDGGYLVGSFYYDNGTYTLFGNTNGQVGTRAYDINNNGWITGETDYNKRRRAFLYHDGTMQTLGGLGDVSQGNAINDSGVIVGTYLLAGNEGAVDARAFVWIDGTMYNLNDLMDSSGAGYTIQQGRDINNSGVIVGDAVDSNGVTRGVILTPNP